MGVTALLLRDLVGYRARTAAADGQGGTTVVYSDPVYVRGRLAIEKGSAEDLGDQLSGRLAASIAIDPRCVTPHEGDRVVTSDSRTWDVLSVAKLSTPGASVCSSDLAILTVVEVLGE